MKRIRSLICLVLCTVAIIGCIPAKASSVTPRYNNIARTSTSFVITNDVAYIGVSYDGYEGVTEGATIKVTLQKKFMLFWWTDVTSWTLNPTSSSYTTTLTYSVSSGTHKAIVEYNVHGSGGATDTVTEEAEYKN